jgi:hypothetical protein
MKTDSATRITADMKILDCRHCGHEFAVLLDFRGADVCDDCWVQLIDVEAQS